MNHDSDKGKLAERLLLIANEKQSPPLALESRKVEGKRLRYSDWLLPGLLAMNIMFGSMFGVGYVIVRYRKNGVLKRMRATPLSAFQFLSAQVISRMFLMVVTSWMVLAGSMLLISFRPQGSWLDLSLFLCVCSAAMISLGLVVAARIATEEVADGILNLMTWPMIFLSGIWFSLDGASSWVLWGAKLMPLTHIVDGLRSILIDGASLAQVYPQVVGLLCLSIVFLAVGSAIFRWR
jgi:ABC-type multidrug transport system permease subunit